MADAEPQKRRVGLAVGSGVVLLGALAALLVSTTATRSKLAVIAHCKSCTGAGKPVESGWVVVQPGDAWSVSLGPGSGLVVRGPARFEVAGTQRVAISAGQVFLASGGAGRPVVLLPQNPTGGVEGATVATDAPGSRLTVVTSGEGNGALVVSGKALIEHGLAPTRLATGSWETGHPPGYAAATPEESAWLDELAR